MCRSHEMQGRGRLQAEESFAGRLEGQSSSQRTVSQGESVCGFYSKYIG